MPQRSRPTELAGPVRALVLGLVGLLAGSLAARSQGLGWSYRRALRAMDKGEHALAAALLEHAIEQSAVPRCRTIHAGIRAIDYIPHYYLGLARLRLGEPEAALAALEDAERMEVTATCPGTVRQAEELRAMLQTLRLARGAAPAAPPVSPQRPEADAPGGPADLTGADLRGADLSGVELRGVSLRGVDLAGADLRGADLRGCDLSGAHLSRALLNRALLAGADLRGAVLAGADLGGAELQGADLSAADLRGARLEGVVIMGATHDADTRWPDGFDPAAAGARRAR